LPSILLHRFFFPIFFFAVKRSSSIEFVSPCSPSALLRQDPAHHDFIRCAATYRCWLRLVSSKACFISHCAAWPLRFFHQMQEDGSPPWFTPLVPSRFLSASMDEVFSYAGATFRSARVLASRNDLLYCHCMSVLFLHHGFMVPGASRVHAQREAPPPDGNKWCHCVHQWRHVLAGQ
jgi:hypothetical protein